MTRGSGACPPPVGAIGQAEEACETSSTSGSEVIRRLSKLAEIGEAKEAGETSSASGNEPTRRLSQMGNPLGIPN